MASVSNEDLIEHIYDASLSPEAWPALLTSLCETIGGSSAWLSRLDVRTGNGAGIIAGIDPEMPELYRQHYGAVNPIAKVENARGFMDAWRPIILTDEDRIPKDELEKSEFYADFLTPQDIHSTLMIRLGAQNFTTTVVNIHRSRRQGRFGQSAMDKSRLLHRHLIRAFRITESMSKADGLSADLASNLDLFLDAMFVLDGVGRLRHANTSARRMLTGLHPFRVTSGSLRAARGDDDKTLQALIGAAGSHTLRRGGSMGMTSKTGGERLMVTVAPIQPERFSVFHDGPSILVCVGATAARAATPEVVLSAKLNLSAAEVRVGVTLLEGMTPAEAAQALGLSIHTVRAHLARMFAKTDTRRQAELVSLMTRTLSGG